MIWQIIVAIVAVIGSVVMQKQMEKEMQDQQAGFLISKSGGSNALRVIYGKRRISTDNVWKGISRFPMAQPVVDADSYYNHYREAAILAGMSPATGYPEGTRSDEDYLHRLDVWCQGPVQSIGNFKIDGDKVSHARFAAGDKAYVRILNKHGGGDQAAFPSLVSGSYDIKSTMVGNDVAYSWSRFFYRVSDPEFQGEPNITAEIEGLKVWDPRLGSDPTVKAWSDNPALCLLDYLTADYGRALPLDEVDLNSFISGANSCDSLVQLPALTTVLDTGDYYNPVTGLMATLQAGDFFPWQRTGQPTGPSSRYRANLILESTNKTIDNCKELLKSMKASMPFAQGKYKLVLEEAGTAVYDFTEDNILGSVSVGWADRSKRLGRCTVKFPNENKGYKPDTVSWPAKDSNLHTAYIAQDNGDELHTEIEVTGVTDLYQARDLAEFTVRDSRTQEFIEFKAQPSALALECGDIITITHGILDYSAKKFRVRGLQLNGDLTVNIKAQVYDDTVYPWNLSNEDTEAANLETEPTAFNTPNIVQNLAASASTDSNQDGTATSRIAVVWDTIVSGTVAVDTVELGLKKSNESEYSWIIVPSDSTQYVYVGLPDFTVFDVAIRYQNTIGKMSATTSVTVTVPDALTNLSSEDLIAQQAAADAAAAAALAQGQADANLAALVLANAAIVAAQADADAAAVLAANAAADAALKQTAAEVATAITNDTTAIDGARITTGTVLAASIVVSGLKTSEMTNDAGFTNDTLATTANAAAATAASDAATAAAAAALADAAAAAAAVTAGAASAAAVAAQSTADAAATAAAGAATVAASKQTAAEVATAITNDTTVVDGSRIVTGTLDGSDITATSVLTVGTGNNVSKMSGTDTDYRLWVGHQTATSAPFAIKKDGSVSIKSASTGERLELDGDSIKVYDAANNLRVKLGNLA